jgi:hypothetical protein
MSVLRGYVYEIRKGLLWNSPMAGSGISDVDLKDYLIIS